MIVGEDDEFVCSEQTQLTVLKTCLFFAGDGFTVYDSHGRLVFRVDSYGPDKGVGGEAVLMDPHGRCLLTVRRKRPSLHRRWEGFLGEGNEGQKEPIFSVRRSSIIARSNSDLTVEVYGDPGEEYRVEGSFVQRCCTVSNAGKEPVAEIRRKVDASTNVTLGKDVFTLSINPGFDAAFAMALVLILDQITTDEDDDEDGVDVGGGEADVAVHPTTED